MTQSAVAAATATASPTPTPARPRRGRPGYDRAQVLDIAVALFNEQGYDATSVADLAQRLGLTKSALYHHFSSKEQLLAVALDTALDSLEAVLDEPAAQQGSAWGRLRHVIAGALAVLVARLPYVTLLLRLRGNSPVELAALDRRRVFDQRVADLVREAQAEGLVRQDIDAHTVTRLIFGMINSTVEWYRPDGSMTDEQLTHSVLTVAMAGIQSREATP